MAAQIYSKSSNLSQKFRRSFIDSLKMNLLVLFSEHHILCAHRVQISKIARIRLSGAPPLCYPHKEGAGSLISRCLH